MPSALTAEQEALTLRNGRPRPRCRLVVCLWGALRGGEGLPLLSGVKRSQQEVDQGKGTGQERGGCKRGRGVAQAQTTNLH